MIPAHSFLIFIIITLFHTSHILLPIDDAFLGMAIGNVSCQADVQQWKLSSQPEMPLVSQLHNATMGCSASLQFFAYSGTIHFLANVEDSRSVIVDKKYWVSPPVMHDAAADASSSFSSSSSVASAPSTPQRPERRERTTEIRACELHVTLSEFNVFPPDPFLDLLTSTIQDFLNAHFQQGVCDYVLPFFEGLLLETEPLLPLMPPEERASTAVPLSNTDAFRSVVNLLHTLPPPVPGAKVTAEFVGETALRLSCQLEEGLSFTYRSGDEKEWKVLQILLSAAVKHLSSFLSQFIPIHAISQQTLSGSILPKANMTAMDEALRTASAGLEGELAAVWHKEQNGRLVSSPSSFFPPGIQLPWSEDTTMDTTFHSELPVHATIYLDINVKGLQWDPETYACYFEREDGVFLSNIRLENAGELGGVLTNFIFPLLTERVNMLLSSALSYLPVETLLAADGSQRELASVPLRKPSVQQVPPIPIMVGYLVISLGLCVGVVERGRRHHRQTPVLSSINMEEVSIIRLVVEDVLLSVGVCVCFGCFVWSNCTTAATVVLGGDLVVYSFSLRSTVTDLWNAGLNPLSFAVALFSGVYPYVKLAGVLYYTAVKQKPDAPMLHVMDYIGKLSLLDTFVMLMMVTGLTIAGVADVVVYPPFYIFLAGTLGSIAMGNYATRLWRRHTTLRLARDDNHWLIFDEDDDTLYVDSISTPNTDLLTQDSVDGAILQEGGEEGERRTSLLCTRLATRARTWVSRFWRRTKRLVYRASSYRCRLAMKRCVVMLVCSLPAWFFPLVSYRVGGVGPLLTSPYKTFNLTQLSAAVDPICLVVTLFTVLIAPCVFVLAPKKLDWLASWCAADALALACLAGLLQLNDFVAFIVGEDLVGIYTAHAILHLSLLPLFLAALYVWWLVIADIFHFKGPMDAWHQIWLAIHERRSEEAERLLVPDGAPTAA